MTIPSILVCLEAVFLGVGFATDLTGETFTSDLVTDLGLPSLFLADKVPFLVEFLPEERPLSSSTLSYWVAGFKSSSISASSIVTKPIVLFGFCGTYLAGDSMVIIGANSSISILKSGFPIISESLSLFLIYSDSFSAPSEASMTFGSLLFCADYLPAEYLFTLDLSLTFPDYTDALADKLPSIFLSLGATFADNFYECAEPFLEEIFECFETETSDYDELFRLIFIGTERSRST